MNLFAVFSKNLIYLNRIKFNKCNKRPFFCVVSSFSQNPRAVVVILLIFEFYREMRDCCNDKRSRARYGIK